MSQTPKSALADLRTEIDRIDAEMHELLIERGRVIDQLIEIKTRQGGGSAFRPAREASMMRAIAERHRGRLPLDTVESIWRVIISTFTLYPSALQRTHRCVRGRRGDARLGPVSFRLHRSVRAALRRGRGDPRSRPNRAAILACLRSMAVREPARGGRSLSRRKRPRSSLGCRSWSAPIIPAGMPVFVISRPLVDGAAREVVLEVDRARPLARRCSPRVAQNRRRSHRLRRRRRGACPAGGAAGRHRRRTR